jgi:hypothetical protein
MQLSQEILHSTFIDGVKEYVTSNSAITMKPLLINFRPPLPVKVRLYLYNATSPPGGRKLGEHKIQLILPGQARGERGAFDYSEGRVVLLAGYQADVEVFIFWDARYYNNFAYSRNVQVKAETIYVALSGELGKQRRLIRGQGEEIVITAQKNKLKEAIMLRVNITREGLINL